MNPRDNYEHHAACDPIPIFQILGFGKLNERGLILIVTCRVSLLALAVIGLLLVILVVGDLADSAACE